MKKLIMCDRWENKTMKNVEFSKWAKAGILSLLTSVAGLPEVQ